MATAAFRSSTKKSTFADAAAGDARSSNRGVMLRRSRSLNRHFTRHTQTSLAVAAEHEEFLDIRLDDLAHEFFLGRYKEQESVKASGRSSRWRDGAMSTMEADASRRRGRSVSAGERKGLLENGERNRGTSGARLRRLRSISVARQRFSDSEDYSSTLTDDEVRDETSRRRVEEKTIRAVSAWNKKEYSKTNGHRNGLHEAMNKEARLAVEEIRKELEQSEKRKQDLLAELAVEEQRNQDLSKIVKDLLPAPKPACLAKRRSCSRRKSNDKITVSNCLIEDADKHIEEFLSSIEDADISSFDGERSDTSSTIVGNSKLSEPITCDSIEELHENTLNPSASPLESEGILLPWLHLETSNEGSSSHCKNKSSFPTDPGSVFCGTFPEFSLISVASEDLTRKQLNDNLQDDQRSSASSDSRGIRSGKFQAASELSPSSSCCSSFFMDEMYHHLLSEGILLARYMERQKIESGSLLICGRSVI